MMINEETGPCEHCQKAFESHTEPEYLYCGHNQVLAFRSSGGYVEHVQVVSTAEAIQILHDRGQLTDQTAMSA
jgi:D-arabinose 1-dehydrogenase-like Zn-dependent alcohol dehydrogenase